MVGPGTPVKTVDPVKAIAKSLTDKYGLIFPIKEEYRSPSAINWNQPEERVLPLIKYLYYHDRRLSRGALTWALQRFDERFFKFKSEWVNKPKAEQDVIPKRELRSYSANQSKTALSNNQGTGSLMLELETVLKDVADNVKNGRIYSLAQEIAHIEPVPVVGKEDPTLTEKATASPQPPLRRSTRMSSRNGKISQYFKPACIQSPLTNANAHASSDEFNVSVDFFNDVEMTSFPDLGSVSRFSLQVPSRSSTPVMPDSPTSPEGAFQTPPVSPLKNRALVVGSRNLPMSMSIPHSISSAFEDLGCGDRGKKRSLPEVSRSESTRKVSRNVSHSTVNGINLTDGTNLPPDQIHLRAHNRKDSASILRNSFSRGSLTSAASANAKTSFQSNDSSTWTSPNTSFRTDTSATSFDSTLDPFEPSNDTRSKAYRDESWTHLEKPFGLGLSGMSDRLIEPGEVEKISMGPPAPIKRSFGSATMTPSTSTEELLAQLSRSSPFDAFSPKVPFSVPFRQLYEVLRVASSTGIELDVFSKCLQQNFDDYETLWSILGKTVNTQKENASLPERSSPTAWASAGSNYDRVLLSGDIKFVDSPGNAIFSLSLKPLRLESSYRLARKFCHDRFLILGFPGLSSEDVPQHLKNCQANLHTAIIKWVLDIEHSFAGRKWRAFYVKPAELKKGRTGANKSNDSRHRIYFFAEDGFDFRHSGGELDPRLRNHNPIGIRQLIDWFMPSKENSDQFCLKFFSRMALGVSATTPTYTFEYAQVIHTRDAKSDCPGVRRLQLDKNSPSNNSSAPEMNDGCSRISKEAARVIAGVLRLSDVPSIFQGRIGGAKGVWMVDPLDEKWPIRAGDSGDIWIEVTTSQLKFQGHPVDAYDPQSHRLTFEVISWSRKLRPSVLNFPLMPILVQGGIPQQVFSHLLEADLTAKVSGLEAAVDSGVGVRKWTQDNGNVAAERGRQKGIEMLGGIPDHRLERINWFVESGFEPRSCQALKDELQKEVHDYCTRLEKKMNVGIGKSTSAYMIADPLAILEENEVHVGFSEVFIDRESGWSDIMLHEVDILVSRSPASLPSDVQKVRAVFKTELRMYRDVIVFSSRGSCSLASKLSGGDYDGDRAWICWEPSIVEPFRNSPVPGPPSLDTYGISKETTKVGEIYDHHDYLTRFLHLGFGFNLQKDLLGSCSNYHKSLCYHEKDISGTSAIEIALLLGLLVDRAKGGYLFDTETWDRYKAKNKLRPNYNKPAYEDQDNPPRQCSNVIDHLIFNVAKGVKDKALSSFHQSFKDVRTYDDELTRISKEATEAAQGDSAAETVLRKLKKEFEKIYEYWRLNGRGQDDDLAVQRPKRGKDLEISFRVLAEKSRDDFLALAPFADEQAMTTNTSSLLKTWHLEWARGGGSWSLLKASMLFSIYHAKSKSFCWFVAGVELGEIKASVGGRGTYRFVVSGLHEAFKIDGKTVDRMLKPDGGLVTDYESGLRVVGDEEMVDEYGDFEGFDDFEYY